jgi:GH15 family glucan-1,4-alpha-glucosidase
MARKKGLPLDSARLEREHDLIYDQIMEKGWDEQRGTFVQYYGAKALDANNLLMPMVKFIAPDDPRMLATIACTREELVEDSLVYRYKIGKAAPDGLEGEEGSFSVCTFWLVEAMTRAGLVDDARLIFEKMAAYANPLGLYSEEIGKSGEALGNFPQAYTHLSLVSAAISLNRALGGQP